MTPNDVPAFIQTDEKAFIRDTANHALLNTDRAALDRYRAQRLKARDLLQRLDSLEREIIALQQWQARMTAPCCTCSNCTTK